VASFEKRAGKDSAVWLNPLPEEQIVKEQYAAH